MIRIGKGKGGVEIDPGKLVGGCALIQGTRGCGKSYLVRVIVEQTIPAGLQTIILDPEGEFATLREKCDILIAGPDGDVPCEVRSAKLLARRVAELGVSTVVDMSDLLRDDQAALVDAFLTELDRLPKRLEQSRLVVIDEAHEFAPEQGKARSQSTKAVIALMSRGRKRGLGAILVTQRLSKLRNDAASEAATRFILRTSPIDLVTAQRLLGITPKEREILRNLPDGVVMAEGAALSHTGVVNFQVRTAQTTHPEPGTRYKVTPPPPKRAVKNLLAELADMPPSKAEEEAASLEAANKKIRELEKRIRALQSETPSEPDTARFKAAVAALAQKIADKATTKQIKQYETMLTKVGRELSKIDRAIETISDASRQAQIYAGEEVLPFAQDDVPKQHPRSSRASSRPPAATNGQKKTPGGGKRRILVALASVGDWVPRPELAILANLSPRTGTFSDYLSLLKREGYIEDAGGQYRITDAGLATLGDYTPVPVSGNDLIDKWRPAGTGGKGRIFNALADAGPRGLDRSDLAAVADLNPRTGTFSDYLSYWRRLGVIEGKGRPRLVEVFFR